MTEPVRIAVIVNDGGLIEQIITVGVPAEVIVVNYDLDGYERDDVVTIDEDGPAQVNVWTADADPAASSFVIKAFEMAQEIGV